MSLYVVAGTPVAHSLSPAMHNAAYEALGMKHNRYGAVDVGADDAHRIVSLLRSGKIAGANITHPLKSRIVPLLDETRGDAQVTGAANTIFMEGDLAIGTSTDGDGCVHALGEKGVSARGKTVLVIGAGGAARPIALALSRESPSLMLIANRTSHKASALADITGTYAPSKGSGLDALQEWMAQADIIVQASSMGMRHHAELPLPPSSALEHQPAIMDIVYNPLETPLLTLARQALCTTLDGIDLLVWQGALSFKLWTGIMPPTDVMRAAALKGMGVEL